MGFIAKLKARNRQGKADGQSLADVCNPSNYAMDVDNDESKPTGDDTPTGSKSIKDSDNE